MVYIPAVDWFRWCVWERLIGIWLAAMIDWVQVRLASISFDLSHGCNQVTFVPWFVEMVDWLVRGVSVDDTYSGSLIGGFVDWDFQQSWLLIGWCSLIRCRWLDVRSYGVTMGYQFGDLIGPSVFQFGFWVIRVVVMTSGYQYGVILTCIFWGGSVAWSAVWSSIFAAEYSYGKLDYHNLCPKTAAIYLSTGDRPIIIWDRSTLGILQSGSDDVGKAGFISLRSEPAVRLGWVVGWAKEVRGLPNIDWSRQVVTVLCCVCDCLCLCCVLVFVLGSSVRVDI